MVLVQRSGTSKGGVSPVPLHGNDWPDTDTTKSVLLEHSHVRRLARRQTRNQFHVALGPVDNDAFGSLSEMVHLERAAHVQTEPRAMPVELAEAIKEIDDVAAYAEEIEVPEPSAIAFENTRRLLKAMYRISPRRFSVYPVADGHIAIDARGNNDNIVVVSCGSDGAILCLVTIDGEDRRSRYATARTLPDGFIREALVAL